MFVMTLVKILRRDVYDERIPTLLTDDSGCLFAFGWLWAGVRECMRMAAYQTIVESPLQQTTGVDLLFVRFLAADC